jgi:hypothetical protein
LVVRDEFGKDFDAPEEAKAHAIKLLRDAVSKRGGELGNLEVIVRDDAGELIRLKASTTK